MLFDVAGKEEMVCSDVYTKHRVDRWLLIPDGVVGQPDRRDHRYSGRGSELLLRPFLFIMLCAFVLSIFRRGNKNLKQECLLTL